MSLADLKAAKSSAKAEFSGVDGVEGFGIGDQSIRVYVRNHAVEQKLPRVFRGVPVEFVVTSNVVALPR
jgi:hypothetical protein